MLTQREIQQLKPDSKLYKRGCGDGLFIVVEKTYKGIEGDKRGGGKYFKGSYKILLGFIIAFGFLVLIKLLTQR